MPSTAFAGNLESSPSCSRPKNSSYTMKQKEISLFLFNLKKTQTGKRITDFMDKNSCIS